MTITATLDSQDQQILERREAAYHSRTGPQVGDYCRTLDGSLRRFTHHWGDCIQVSDGQGSYYLGDDDVSYSGGLDPAIPLNRLVTTAEKLPAAFWFFHHDEYRAHNGIDVTILVPVWAMATVLAVARG